jgi:hypothetical protein
MKTFSVYANNVAHGLHIIAKYELNGSIDKPFLYRQSSNKWIMSWQQMDDDKKVQLYVPLSSKIIKSLVVKYGKRMEEGLVSCALKFQEKNFVRLIWRHMNDKSKTKLMAGFLGGK